MLAAPFFMYATPLRPQIKTSQLVSFWLILGLVMKNVGIFEGKTHFSALIHDAANGQTIIITKNGKPVAQIGPVTAVSSPSTAEKAMERILASRSIRGKASARELIEEGRRY